MLKKNTNKLISALSILETIYEINPRNLNSIELKLEILKVMKNKKLLNVTIERLKKEKKIFYFYKILKDKKLKKVLLKLLK